MCKAVRLYADGRRNRCPYTPQAGDTLCYYCRKIADHKSEPLEGLDQTDTVVGFWDDNKVLTVFNETLLNDVTKSLLNAATTVTTTEGSTIG